MLVSLCTTLLVFALTPDATLLGALKMMAFGTVLSIAITAIYPEVRGVKAGDTVSVVTGGGLPSLLGRIGRASAAARKNEQIKIILDNGNEVVGVVESYTGLIGPAKIRLLYEEKLVE
ncbi:Uncharacterised protein [Candidatus Bilamarchaeum dharawalense]|uniref:Uncharacterized protein n=1 Tax=Candidatus Bilamarchaeum dharawalense TaxID=2885759 RepID=A0A5E4LRX7_9ARCH|nr:Uncharacterised protein [Candidatus Bilamarchaeum dharawalense]